MRYAKRNRDRNAPRAFKELRGTFEAPGQLAVDNFLSGYLVWTQIWDTEQTAATNVDSDGG
jgi:hypothetical protein